MAPLVILCYICLRIYFQIHLKVEIATQKASEASKRLDSSGTENTHLFEVCVCSRGGSRKQPADCTSRLRDRASNRTMQQEQPTIQKTLKRTASWPRSLMETIADVKRTPLRTRGTHQVFPSSQSTKTTSFAILSDQPRGSSDPDPVEQREHVPQTADGVQPDDVEDQSAEFGNRSARDMYPFPRLTISYLI